MSAERGQAAGTSFGRATEEVMPDARVVRLSLLRHGAVRDLERRIARGQLDTGLSDPGLEEERRLVRALSIARPDVERVFSSDLPRCRSLSEALAGALGREVEYDERLREQSLGTWEGRTWDELSEEQPGRISAYWADYASTRPPEGESLIDVDARVHAFWREVRDSLLDRRAIVVTHVGVLRCFVARLLGLPLDAALRLAPATGSHTEVLWSNAGGVLNAFGERPWFGAEAT